MAEGLRSWLLIGLCSGLVPAYLLRQSSFLQLYCPSPPSDRDGIVIVQESHGQLFNSHNRCQQISSDKLISINIFPIAKGIYVENLETAVSVICPYSSIRPGSPLQLMHSSLICQWLPFFSISVTFIFLRPQGPVWPPHREGRKYRGVNTSGAILNNGDESGWVNTPAVWPLVPDSTEVCSTRPLRESLGISFQLLTLATHSPMHCFLAFFPSLFHFPTSLLVLPGIISKHTTCTQILVLGVRRTQTMQEQSGRSLLPRERQLTFILSFYSSLSLSLSIYIHIFPLRSNQLIFYIFPFLFPVLHAIHHILLLNSYLTVVLWTFVRSWKLWYRK